MGFFIKLFFSFLFFSRNGPEGSSRRMGRRINKESAMPLPKIKRKRVVLVPEPVSGAKNSRHPEGIAKRYYKIR